MQPRFFIKVLPLKPQVLHRPFVAVLPYPLFPHRIAVLNRAQYSRVVEMLRRTPRPVGRRPDDIAIVVGQFPWRAEVVAVMAWCDGIVCGWKLGIGQLLSPVWRGLYRMQ